MGSTRAGGRSRTPRQGRVTEPGSRRGRLVATPVFAGSVGLLLLNDHVLKAAWPGWVTGKLSDVAGVVMVAIALTALIRVRAVAFGITVCAFTLLKTVPAVAGWAAPILGGVTRTDHTDLLALTALVPLARWMAGSAPPPPKPRRATVVRVRLALQVILIGAAIFATTATSADCGPTGLWDVQVIDDVVYAREDQNVWTSTDGGASWQSSAIPTNDHRFANGPKFESCAGDRCFHIVTSASDDSFEIVETVGGTETEILRVGSEQRREFRSEIQPSCGDDSGGDVAAVEVDGDVSVVVGMGEAGTLHRSADHGWEWVAVGQWGVGSGVATGDTFLGHPIAERPDRPPFSSRWTARALLWAAPILSFGAAAPLAALAHRRGRSRVAALSLAVLLGLVVLAPSLLLSSLLDGATDRSLGGFLIGGGIILFLAVVGVGSLAVWFGRDARPLQPDPGWTSTTPAWPPPPSQRPPNPD
ncbi:MAG: hypothetical protein R8G01_21675 [Ilumatobacteraceae bacterium]|nr:hypothetical protein [Ilumatobacteraceae bacterium]